MPRRVGRPKGADSTVVNVRLPVSLVQRLDRYLDKLETETGLSTHRGMILRHSLKNFPGGQRHVAYRASAPA
jgi:hypothetical protein